MCTSSDHRVTNDGLWMHMVGEKENSRATTNGCAIMNGRVLYLIFSSLISLYYKNRIYQKMQREKLYTLHTTAFFIVALFVFKMDKTFSNQILTVRKRCFFLTERTFLFFFFHLFIVSNCLLEKNNIY